MIYLGVGHLKRVTVEQIVKKIICDALTTTDFWEDNCFYNYMEMTTKEATTVQTELNKMVKEIEDKFDLFDLKK